MVLFRGNRPSGGTYFFSVGLIDRSSSLLVERIDDLNESFQAVLKERPFRLDAMVVLPDHVHALWTLPEGDEDFSDRWRRFKARFTRAVAHGREGLARNDRGEWNLWQRRFYDYRIRDDLDFRRHMDYIHFNPVKHGLVEKAADWPHSTFHRFVSAGMYPAQWAGVPQLEGKFGE